MLTMVNFFKRKLMGATSRMTLQILKNKKKHCKWSHTDLIYQFPNVKCSQKKKKKEPRSVTTHSTIIITFNPS